MTGKLVLKMILVLRYFWNRGLRKLIPAEIYLQGLTLEQQGLSCHYYYLCYYCFALMSVMGWTNDRMSRSSQWVAR